MSIKKSKYFKKTVKNFQKGGNKSPDFLNLLVNKLEKANVKFESTKPSYKYKELNKKKLIDLCKSFNINIRYNDTNEILMDKLDLFLNTYKDVNDKEEKKFQEVLKDKSIPKGFSTKDDVIVSDDSKNKLEIDIERIENKIDTIQLLLQNILNEKKEKISEESILPEINEKEKTSEGDIIKYDSQNQNTQEGFISPVIQEGLENTDKKVISPVVQEDILPIETKSDEKKENKKEGIIESIIKGLGGGKKTKKRRLNKTRKSKKY